MSADAIWIGMDGQRHGPYSLDTVREWLANGQVTLGTLAWREGMTTWKPLTELLAREYLARSATSTDTALPPPPPPAAHPGPAFSAPERTERPAAARRHHLPRPPSLHWFVVFLLSAVTLGIFYWVWLFVQSRWIKKVDPESRATTFFLTALLGSLALGFVAGLTGMRINTIVTTVSTALIVGGCIDMRKSLLRLAAEHGLPMKIGYITLIFFQMIYLQGQLTWLARWKDTGQTEPRAPKATIWLLTIPFLLIILAAIAIPQYQNYAIRKQVLESVSHAETAKIAVVAYFQQHGRLAPTGEDAGFYDNYAVHGKYVDKMVVSQGLIAIRFGASASPKLAGHYVMLRPEVEGKDMHFECKALDIEPRYLPPACR